MKKITALIIASALVSGCSSAPPKWLVGNTDCGYMGCEHGDVRFYPNEQFASQKQTRRYCGFEWGQTSSAYHPSSPEYKRLRAQEIARWKGENTMDLCYK
jgi:hypothetical protein